MTTPRENRAPARIWIDAKITGESCYRELYSATRNKHDDIVLKLDGGEVWQFTPHSKINPFPISQVKQVGWMHNSKTGALTAKACIILKDPKRVFEGNLRTMPAATPTIEPSKKHLMYIFREKNKGFEMWYEGREIDIFDKTVGMKVLNALLKNPFIGFNATRLHSTIHSSTSEAVIKAGKLSPRQIGKGGQNEQGDDQTDDTLTVCENWTPQERMDKKTRHDAIEGKKELEEILRTTTDENRRRELENAISRFEKRLAADTATPPGRQSYDKGFTTTNGSYSFANYLKQLNAAIAIISKTDQLAGKFLQSTTERSKRIFKYTGSIHWET